MYLAKNNAYSTLAAGISSGATSLTVAAGHGDRFPVIAGSDYTKITLEDVAGNREIIHLTARAAASDVFTTIVRAQEGTTARAWALGDVVELRQTADLVQTAMGHPALATAAHAATAIANTPAGNIAATNVQSALNELDAEKQAALGFTPANDTLGNLSNKATARANIGIEAAEADVASATTCDIGAATSMNVRITGTVTITGLGAAAAGVMRKVRMAAAALLTHNATSLILPGSANIATAAGDCFEAHSLGSGNWVVAQYQRADGTALAAVSVPSGAIMPFAGSTAPSGWLLSYGQAISRTTYAALFAAIGTAHGVGDGSTTFNVPDMRGRVVAGQDNMGGSTASRLTSGGSGIAGTTLGASGGSETHTLTTAQLASHTHSYNVGSANSGSVSANDQSGGSTSPSGNTTGAAGSGTAHNNTQPTLICNYIIKL